MNPAGKPLFASLFLHGAAVLMAATLVVERPGVPLTTGGNDDPWVLLPVPDAASDVPESATADSASSTLLPEPTASQQTPSLSSPDLPPAQIASPARDRVAPTAQSSLPTIAPPPIVGKKSPRKASGKSAATRSGGGVGSAKYSPARYARCPAPLFPAEARKAGISGIVLLLVEVDENGRPTEVAVHRSSGHETLDAAALRAVRAWRFEPARISGKPVGSRLEIPVRFALS